MKYVENIGKSIAVPVDEIAHDKDIIGFTHPNLHRRIRTGSEEYEIRQIEYGRFAGLYGIFVEGDEPTIESFKEDGSPGDPVIFNQLICVSEDAPTVEEAMQIVHDFMLKDLPIGEIAFRKYELAINGVNSYRTTHMTTHDEDSVTCEIP